MSLWVIASPASQPSKRKDHVQWIVLASGTSTLIKFQNVGQIWLTADDHIFRQTTFTVMQMVSNKRKRHTLDNKLQKPLNFDYFVVVFFCCFF